MAKVKIEPIKKPYKLINYWKKEKFIVSVIIITGVIFNVMNIFNPIFRGKLIDSLVNDDTLNQIINTALIYVSVVLAIQFIRILKRYYIRRFANKTSATMRFTVYNNIMYKSFEELDRENSGDLMTKALSDVDLCVEGMRKFTTEIFDTWVFMISYIVTMFFYDVKITLFSCLFVPIAMVIAEKMKTVIYKYSVAYRLKSSEITSITYDSIENAMLYRASGMEMQRNITYANELEDYRNKSVKANILENSMQPVYNVIALFGIITVIYFGGKKVIEGNWSIGIFSTYLAMFTALASKAGKASKLFNSVQKSQVSWERIKPYLTEYRSKESGGIIKSGEITLEAENLSFSYGSKENVIENLGFSAKQGDIIGITGPIACGKSTLGLALTGIYPYIGSIKAGGRELRDYSESERSEMIAYMGHKPQLLSDTIYNNITLGKDMDISTVLREVCFETDLLTMPEGENTLVGNGGIRLSGGQQSRIALARTLLNKNKIIILDDPFSAVDMKTEEKIIDNLRNNYKDCIIVLISHRMAVFPEINNIILLHLNKTAEIGTHKELIASSKLYETIFNLQNGKENDNE